MIRIAIDQARSWAKSTYPGARRDLDLAYAEPRSGASRRGWVVRLPAGTLRSNPLRGR
jgi:hypothetical protein